MSNAVAESCFTFGNIYGSGKIINFDTFRKSCVNTIALLCRRNNIIPRLLFQVNNGIAITQFLRPDRFIDGLIAGKPSHNCRQYKKGGKYFFNIFHEGLCFVSISNVKM